MEASVVGVAILVALVLINAGYWLAISLVRWAPVLIIGAVTGWLALRHGLTPLEALALGALASMLMRHVRRRADQAHGWYD